MSHQNGFSTTINWYTKNAKEYTDQIAASTENELLKRFINQFQEGMTVLDAGCAGGRDSHAFDLHGLKPTGIDITESFIKIAQEKYPEIDFVCGSFLELPFSDESFNGVWAHASLLHFEEISDVKRSLREFFRVLKKGGILHVFVKQQLSDAKTEEVAHTYSGEFKRFFRYFTKDEIQQYLLEAGFKILELQDNYVPMDGRKGIKWVVALAKKA